MVSHTNPQIVIMVAPTPSRLHVVHRFHDQILGNRFEKRETVAQICRVAVRWAVDR